MIRFSVCSLLAALISSAAYADTLIEGYLCCNMRTDGSWISDINYAENGKRLIPLGTSAKVTDYGRYRVYVELDGSKQAIGNDYSRDLDLAIFAQRYVVKENPKTKLASYPAKVRQAITTARLMPGMTREQVFMSVGYPVSSENPHLDAKVLRFWLSSFAEFQVIFDNQNRVKEITAEPLTRNLVVME